MDWTWQNLDLKHVLDYEYYKCSGKIFPSHCATGSARGMLDVFCQTISTDKGKQIGRVQGEKCPRIRFIPEIAEFMHKRSRDTHFELEPDWSCH